jgi:hypothetical protein
MASISIRMPGASPACTVVRTGKWTGPSSQLAGRAGLRAHFAATGWGPHIAAKTMVTAESNRFPGGTEFWHPRGLGLALSLLRVPGGAEAARYSSCNRRASKSDE